MGQDVRIRHATRQDLPAVLALVPRLHGGTLPRWRSAEAMNAAKSRILTDAVISGAAEVLVAETEVRGPIVGFIHLVAARDPVTDEAHGHISNLVVAEDEQGAGVGEALMLAAEGWMIGQGYRLATVGVFPDNQRARRLYERIGYATDTIRMAKLLDREEG